MMRIPMIFAMLAAGGAILPAVAQTTSSNASTVQPAPALPPTKELPYDRGYDKTTPRTQAVNAVEAPVTAKLNEQAGAGAAINADATAAITAEGQAQYASDQASYLTALAQHDRAVDRSDARYARQQRAYADAMAVWRWQVNECKKGHQRACNMPSPVVADFY